MAMAGAGDSDRTRGDPLQARTADEIDAAVAEAVVAGVAALHVNTEPLFGAATGFPIVRLAPCVARPREPWRA
jgi:hypothetical protein